MHEEDKCDRAPWRASSTLQGKKAHRSANVLSSALCTVLLGCARRALRAGVAGLSFALKACGAGDTVLFQDI